MGHRESAAGGLDLLPRACPSGDDRHRGRHRLEHAQAEALRVRAHHQGVGVRQERPLVGLADLSDPVHGVAHGSEEWLHAAPVPVLVGPRDDQSRRPVARPHLREGGGEQIEALDRVQAPEEHDEGRVGGQAEPATKAPASERPRPRERRRRSGAWRRARSGRVARACSPRRRTPREAARRPRGGGARASSTPPACATRDGRATRRRASRAEKSRTGSAAAAHDAPPSTPASARARACARDRSRPI